MADELIYFTWLLKIIFYFTFSWQIWVEGFKAEIWMAGEEKTCDDVGGMPKSIKRSEVDS